MATRNWKHGWIPISAAAKAFVAGKGPRPNRTKTVYASDAAIVAEARMRIAERRRERSRQFNPASGSHASGSGQRKPNQMFTADFVGGMPVMGITRVPPGAKVIKKPKADTPQTYVADYVGGAPVMAGLPRKWKYKS